MTNSYFQKANLNATNSELDAKVVIDHTKLSDEEEEKINQDLMKEAERREQSNIYYTISNRRRINQCQFFQN